MRKGEPRGATTTTLGRDVFLLREEEDDNDDGSNKK